MNGEPVNLFLFLRATAFALGRDILTGKQAAVAQLAALDSNGTTGTGIVVRADQIALEVGISTSQVWRHFSALVSAGWFEQTTRPARGSNGQPGRKARYRCTLPPLDLGLATITECDNRPERVASSGEDVRDVPHPERVASSGGGMRHDRGERVASSGGEMRHDRPSDPPERVASSGEAMRNDMTERVASAGETCRISGPNVSHRQAGIWDSLPSDGSPSDGSPTLVAGTVPKAEDARARDPEAERQRQLSAIETRERLKAEARAAVRAAHAADQQPPASPGDTQPPGATDPGDVDAPDRGDQLNGQPPPPTDDPEHIPTGLWTGSDSTLSLAEVEEMLGAQVGAQVIEREAT